MIPAPAARRRWLYPDLSGLAPSANVPTSVTTASKGSTTAPSMTGSLGWYREKRTGLAELAPASWNTDQTPSLDRTGSTRYTYPGTGNPINYSAPSGRYVATDYKPGSTAALQAARWLFTLDFWLDGDAFEFRWQANAASGRIGLLVVDGKRVQAAPFTYSGLTGGSGYATTVTFPDRRLRHIQLYGINSGEGRFGGVAINDTAGHTITKPASQGRTIAVVGDSWVNGGQTGQASQVETFAWKMALQLGAQTVIQAGIGSTGYAAVLTGQPTSNLAGRTALVLAEQPDLVILAAGRNDASGNQSVIESTIQDYLTGGMPASKILMVPTCSESAQAGVRADQIAAAAAKGVRFIDMPVDSYAKIAGDTAHMTLAAHQQFGADAAYKVIAA